MSINDIQKTAAQILKLAGVNPHFTAAELKREHEYRKLEAEGLGRNPARAQKEADEWLQNASR